ncbi:MAG: ABC transporter permease [Clostridiales Family XIII bacterium]|jgi:ABC-type antimicrobial peptide transport system permease subunit|nr:ABC transporter permease [Clostridiales Family XIII bacterium]
MKPVDLFSFSIDNLRRRKSRTVLTVIGVVVGVCAIVVMISLGIAVNRATDAMLQNWGDLTKIEVVRYGAQQGTPDLDDKMVGIFQKTPHVIASTPMYQPNGFWGQLVGGRGNRYVGSAQLVGMEPTAIEPMGYKLLTGNWDVDTYLGKGKIPVLIGEQAPFSFMDSKKSASSPDAMKYPAYDENYTSISNLPRYDANGALLNPEDFFFDVMTSKLTYRMQIGYDAETDVTTYKDYEFVPVGMISGGMNDYMISNGVIMSIKNVKLLESDYRKATGSASGSAGSGGIVMDSGGGRGNTTTVKGYDTVYVKVDDVKNVADIEKSIKEAGYQIYSMSETRKQMQGQVAQTQMMLGGLAAVSLFVAALNIMNTMTMAITERTREIGVMKVLGCRLRDIRRMFLIESGCIGFIGGAVGCVASVLLSLLLNHLPNILGALGIKGDVDLASFFGLGGMASQMPDMKLSIIPPWLIILALAFATGVGLVSGISPSNRAVRISSLEAIRHE